MRIGNKTLATVAIIASLSTILVAAMSGFFYGRQYEARTSWEKGKFLHTNRYYIRTDNFSGDLGGWKENEFRWVDRVRKAVEENLKDLYKSKKIPSGRSWDIDYAFDTDRSPVALITVRYHERVRIEYVISVGRIFEQMKEIERSKGVGQMIDHFHNETSFFITALTSLLTQRLTGSPPEFKFFDPDRL